MVVDTSALLALQFGEPSAAWVVEQLRHSETEPKMCTVNFTEALIRIRSVQPTLYRQLRDDIRELVRLVSPSAEQAEIAAWARLAYPINLGDCFAYALAKDVGEPLLTLDSDFLKTDIVVVSPPQH